MTTTRMTRYPIATRRLPCRPVSATVYHFIGEKTILSTRSTDASITTKEQDYSQSETVSRVPNSAPATDRDDSPFEMVCYRVPLAVSVDNYKLGQRRASFPAATLSWPADNRCQLSLIDQ